MVSYVEGATRTGYPVELLNLTRAVDLPQMLCALLDGHTRSCLRTAALRAAALTSPQYSAAELVAALCELAQQCSSTGRLRPNVDADASTLDREQTMQTVTRLFCSRSITSQPKYRTLCAAYTE